MDGYSVERIVGRITRIYQASQKSQVSRARMEEYARGLPMWYARLVGTVGQKEARVIMMKIKVPVPVTGGGDTDGR